MNTILLNSTIYYNKNVSNCFVILKKQLPNHIYKLNTVRKSLENHHNTHRILVIDFQKDHQS